jgi:hypothetical protein
MRVYVGLASVFAFCLALAPARGDTPATDRWFLAATAFNSASTAALMTQPDFLCGKTFETIDCHVGEQQTVVGFYGVWQLYRYDRKHHIALAGANTDQETWALFSAPPPPRSVPDADLSQWTTARGLRIGSPYAQVLATYGGPKKYGQRIVTAYSANFPAIDPIFGRKETLNELVTLVITGGQVSSISVYIDCCNG